MPRQFIPLDSPDVSPPPNRLRNPGDIRMRDPGDIRIDLNDAVEYANYNYYLTPLKVTNIGKLQLPFTVPFGHNLVKLETLERDQYLIRCSHGLLHAVSAMELIDTISETYSEHVEGYDDALNRMAVAFSISNKKLIDLIKIAALFHDSARLGDGEDLWDPQSAAACKTYLKSEQCHVPDDLASFIADTIAFKDNKDKFVEKWRWVGLETGGPIICDFARQLLNMADCLEVMRCRTVFDVKYLPIAEHLDADVIKNKIIPNLVVNHRQKISEEGRLSKKGLIQFKGELFSEAPKKAAYDYSLMGLRYQKISRDYALGIEMLDFQNDAHLEVFIDKALRGIQTYLEEYKNASGFSFFHQGFFKPRWHGTTGIKRAEYFKKQLSKSSDDLQKKTILLSALIKNHDGSTLQEHVMRSLNQSNKAKILGQLKARMDEQNTDNLQQDKDVSRFIGMANGTL